MNAVSIIMAAFAMLGAADRILGGRFGLAEEFEKGFQMFGSLALAMIGMIAVSPLIANALAPALNAIHRTLGLDHSIIPASLFAIDMGGAPLAAEVAKDARIGRFSGIVIASMMGCTISFTIPCALSTVKPERRRELLLGLLCGVVTIPAGCFVGGIAMGIPLSSLAWNLLPLIVLSVLFAVGLAKCPDLCVKIFSVFGRIIEILITVGLALSLLKFLTGVEIVPGMESFEEGAMLVLNACAVMTGALPMLKILSKLLSKPMHALGARLRVNDASMLGFIGTLATSISTYEMMDKMDRRGAVLNAAFTVSAAFALADHLAFTLAFDAACLPAMLAGKLTAGVLAVLVAMPVSRKLIAW